MEYVDGKTLDEVEAPTMAQLVLIFNQVAEALVHMHRRGVYHGDLKPGNIMVTKDGKVKLIDFGTAWLKGEVKNRIQGTPQYMAPESATEKVVDERTDIYNFGATMYRMFTGRYANPGSMPTDRRQPQGQARRRRSRSTRAFPARSTRPSSPASSSAPIGAPPGCSRSSTSSPPWPSTSASTRSS